MRLKNHDKNVLAKSSCVTSQLIFCFFLISQVRAKICAYLQQEQSGRGKLDKPRPSNLLCVMADQTLFSIVEWARSCIFFKELKVCC